MRPLLLALLALLTYSLPAAAQKAEKPACYFVQFRAYHHKETLRYLYYKINNGTAIYHTDSSGYGLQCARVNDTVRIVSDMFMPEYVVLKEQYVKNGHIDVWLRVKSHELDEVEIKDSSDFFAKEQNWAGYQPPKPESQVEKNSQLKKGSGAGLPLFTFLHEKLGKKFKEYRKADQMAKKDYYDKLKEERLSIGLIKFCVPISDEDVFDFYTYCNLPQEVLQNASTLEISLWVKEYYAKYVARGKK